jgi:hypothetical protein
MLSQCQELTVCAWRYHIILSSKELTERRTNSAVAKPEVSMLLTLKPTIGHHHELVMYTVLFPKFYHRDVPPRCWSSKRTSSKSQFLVYQKHLELFSERLPHKILYILPASLILATHPCIIPCYVLLPYSTVWSVWAIHHAVSHTAHLRTSERLGLATLISFMFLAHYNIPSHTHTYQAAKSLFRVSWSSVFRTVDRLLTDLERGNSKHVRNLARSLLLRDTIILMSKICFNHTVCGQLTESSCRISSFLLPACSSVSLEEVCGPLSVSK